MAAPLKDQFDPALVAELAGRVVAVHAEFDTDGFVRAVLPELEPLELKDRVNLIADQLCAHLPDDYPEALAVVVAVAEGEPDAWQGWPLCSFVERHGIDHPHESLAAMPILTRVWSCEFAIRPFLDHHLALTREHLRRWVHDPDPAVRRLPSEGTRPLLPWGPRVRALTDDPSIGIELLRELRRDPDEVVRRSVANHLNDVAKAHPGRVVDELAGWVDDGVDEAMVRHALRTLVKQGDPRAMAVLGYATEAELEVDWFTCDPAHLHLGERITLSCALRSTADTDQRVVVDFVIHHINASGGTSPKVFKWTTVDLAAGATAGLTKRRLIATASTRRYHAGHHRVELQVAGTVMAATHFDLRDSS